jgi:predicted Zn-dependent protease
MTKGDGKPDLAKIMNTTAQQWTSPGGNKMPLYAQAWGIVNCLLTSGTRGQRNVNILIQAFRSGKGHRTGVKLLAPQTMAMLTRQYDEYIKSVVVPHCEYGLPVSKLVASDKDDEAAARLKEGLGKFPKNNELLFFKGLLALKAGDAAGALAILKPLDKRHPRHPHLTGAIGRATFESGDRIGAARWLRNALKENLRDKRAEELLEQVKQKPR